MKAVILVFPGSNRERDLQIALKTLTDREPQLVWHGEHQLPEGTDLVALPGGFSYGDYLRCGAIAARSNIISAIQKHAQNGGYVLGICNGFQILCETGLLPGVLQRNRGLHFICRDVHLRVERNDTAFSSAYKSGEVIRVPVAHGEGNYTTTTDMLHQLEQERRVLLRYTNANGDTDDGSNINGASNAIAGVLSENARVLGLMPHPENAIEQRHGSTGGAGLFHSLLGAMVAA